MQLAWKQGISANNEVIIGVNFSPPDLTDMSFAQKDTEDGWNLEIAIPM